MIDENIIPRVLSKKITFMTGLTIVDWCKVMGYRRASLYQALRGDGSRNMRIILANFAGMKPSKLWPSRCEEKNMLDDALYIEMNNTFQL